MSVDLLIIGGGINGCAIAADAAGRGLSVTLCEMNDIASGTSSGSSKLIHGGLRYLETYDFKLVRHALKEREVLMRKAPFLVTPLEFILPYEEHLRSPFLLRSGLFLYDHLAKRKKIPASKKVLFNGKILKDNFNFGFSYYDCWADDSRLTILNALDARRHGADILTRTKCTKLEKNSNGWLATLVNTLTNNEIQLQTKAIVNATGPWIDQFNKDTARIKTNSHVELIKGSHIILPKLYEGAHAYILQNKDNRIVFAIPYLDKFTLIGTTDITYTGDPANVNISEDEKEYLCNIINHYFKKQISKSDIVSAYSAVRPLYNNHASNPSKVTRDYHLELINDAASPYLSIYGGKITTHRVLAEDTLKQLAPYFPNMNPAWTAESSLPGGDLDGLPWSDFLKQCFQTYHWLPKSQIKRYASAYGSNIHALMNDSNKIEDLGRYFGADLYEREIMYWIQNELAQTPEDMLWRRSKLGLLLNTQEISILHAFLNE